MTNSAVSDLLASGSTLFAKAGHTWVQRTRVKGLWLPALFESIQIVGNFIPVSH